MMRTSTRTSSRLSSLALAATLLLAAGAFGQALEAAMGDPSRPGVPIYDLDPPVLPIPQLDNTKSSPRQGSVLRLTNSWNRLLKELDHAQRRLSFDENESLDAILKQIQSGLISTGSVVSRGTPPVTDLNALRQLVPNTSALGGFFKNKYKENPKVREFKRLSGYASALAEESRKLAPVVPRGMIRAE